MDNTKTKVVLATLVAVAAMIGLGATFPGGALPKVARSGRGSRL